MSKQTKPLTAASKEAKGSLEFPDCLIRDARAINQLATLIEAPRSHAVIAAAIYLGLNDVASNVGLYETGFDVNICSN